LQPENTETVGCVPLEVRVHVMNETRRDDPDNRAEDQESCQRVGQDRRPAARDTITATEASKANASVQIGPQRSGLHRRHSTSARAIQESGLIKVPKGIEIKEA